MRRNQSDKPLRKGVRFKVRFGQRMTEFEVRGLHAADDVRLGGAR